MCLYPFLCSPYKKHSNSSLKSILDDFTRRKKWVSKTLTWYFFNILKKYLIFLIFNILLIFDISSLHTKKLYVGYIRNVSFSPTSCCHTTNNFKCKLLCPPDNFKLFASLGSYISGLGRKKDFLRKKALSFSLTLPFWLRYKENHLLSLGLQICICHVKGVCVQAQVLQSCPALCDPVDHGLPGSSVHGILQWAAMPSSRGSSWPRDGGCFS